MANVFITGGAGFIGSHIARNLVNRGVYNVTLFDAFLNYANHFNNPYFKCLDFRLKDLQDKVEIIRGDVRNKLTVWRAMQQSKPDTVIHLAAMPIAQASSKFSEEAYEINLTGTRNVLEAVRDTPSVKRVIYASSSMVYGHFNKDEVDEEHPTNPIEVYGGTKLAAEILIKSYGKNFNIPYTIIRPSAVYGPTDVNRRVTQIFVENALKGKPLVMDGGGVSKLDFSYVEDVAEGFINAMESSNAINQTFNITRGSARQVREYAELVVKHIPGSKIEAGPVDTTRPERGTLSIEKARKLIGYSPTHDIEKGVAKYVAFLKENNYLA